MKSAAHLAVTKAAKKAVSWAAKSADETAVTKAVLWAAQRVALSNKT